MSLVVMIALGLIPWVIAVQRLIRGRNRDLDIAGLDQPNSNFPRATATDAENSKLLADDTLFGAIITDTPNPISNTSGPHIVAEAPQQQGAVVRAGGATAATAKKDASMATSSSSLAQSGSAQSGSAQSAAQQWPRISPDLAIIDDFVPGDDMLELTLDEVEVAAAERAGVRLDIRVERSSTGRGSLITVGGTPLAFVRGSTHVTPRDVVLRIDRLN